MNTRFKLVHLVVVTPIAILGLAGVALADPPSELISPPNHRHFIVTPHGPVPVGPQICQDPNLQQAFNEYHYNVHHSEVPGLGDILTLGPQDGAPGLHNEVGAEVIGVRGCS
ncbi:MAG TPA: hypothetical protein VLI04_06675 [Nocardioidaceae bacterium]|nr:hypothetical protein [Nocardioidaceae bacterium]